MFLRRINYPGTTGLIFRRVYDDLKRNHIDKFFEEFPHLFQFYRATDHEIIFPPVQKADGSFHPPSRIVFAYAETEAEVKRKFHGPEYMDMFIDQAEQLDETEMKIMRTCCRWPGVSQYRCKFVVFFNPGGKGLPFLKRVFRDKKFRDKERAEDFSFIQAYGWDNVEWVRSALIEDGKTDEDFYSWSNETRFEYFIARSQYGRQLDSLPPAMRIGHLLGSLDTFAGQYFDVWDGSQVNRAEIPVWCPRWLSIDWGFAHNSAVLWWAQDGETTRTYKELVKAGLGPRALAQEIADRCRYDGGKDKIDAVYLSPDAFAKRTNEDTIAQQIGSVLRQYGLPTPRAADNDRISGWMLMYEMLKYGKWVVDPSCEDLIKNIPLLSRDEDPEKNEDCIKYDGDDSVDSARYGLKSRFPSREIPKQVQLGSVLTEIQKKAADLAEAHTRMHMAHLKFDEEWKRKHAPVRRIRRWRRSAV